MIRLNKVPENSESYWIASTGTTNYPVLNEDLNMDIAIIGGGMVGITAGFLLKQEGYKVAVIDAGKIIHGTSGHTTAKITSQHGLIYDKIYNQMSPEKAKQYAEANEYAIDFIANLVKDKNIECDFLRKPAYIYTESEEYINKIQKEVEIASSLGITATYEENIPLPFKIKSAMKFENQAQFHPRKYLLALSKELPNNGSYIFENTRVVDIDKSEEANERIVIKTENGRKIYAAKVIIASHFPCYDGKGLYFTRMYQEKSYVLAVKIKEKFSDGMFISAEDPGRSLRSQIDNHEEILLIGGEHHKTGHDNDTLKHYNNLLKFATANYNVENVLYRWSTQDCMTMDGVPYIGHLTSKTNNIYVATGFQKWGMTSSTVSALIIRDLIVKGESPWYDVYNPSRTTIGASAGEFIAQNADVAVNFISGKLQTLPNNVEIQNNEAKIIDVEGKRAGAYRDNDGKLHIIDTTCTHLGCELQWNNAEKSWDCPCHGSRFNYDGIIIEGPAINPLNSAKDEPNNIDPNIN